MTVVIDMLDEGPFPVEELVIDLLFPERVRVERGPPVWQGLEGPVLSDHGAFVVVELRARDDAGPADFRVRLPRAMVVDAATPRKLSSPASG